MHSRDATSAGLRPVGSTPRQDCRASIASMNKGFFAVRRRRRRRRCVSTSLPFSPPALLRQPRDPAGDGRHPAPEPTRLSRDGLSPSPCVSGGPCPRGESV